MKQYVYALNLQTNAEQRFTSAQWSDILRNGLKDRYKFIKTSHEQDHEAEAARLAKQQAPKKGCGCNK